MKRLLAILLVLVFVMAPLASFADENPPVTDPEDPPATEPEQPTQPPAIDNGKLPKKLTHSTGHFAPEQEFKFTFEKVDNPPYGVGPDIQPVTINFPSSNADQTLEGDIVLPDASTFGRTGVFKYTVHESPINTAGFETDPTIGELTVLVTREGENLVAKAYLVIPGSPTKKDYFENDFKGGNLTVTKEVTGNLGDKQKKFTIYITLKAPKDQVVAVDALVFKVGGQEVTVDNIENFETTGSIDLEFEIADEESIEILNLPQGVTFVVSEASYADDGYATTIDTPEGTITQDTPVTVTNHKEGQVPTGITLDNLPYIIMLVAAVAGMAIFVLRKRANEIN